MTATQTADHFDLLEFLYVVFLRIMALFFLGFALQYWLRLIGFWEGPQFQFDTMSTAWKAAAATLAVLHPVTALAVWGLFSWGAVVWFVAIVLETAMFAGFPGIFGDNMELVIFHWGCFGLFALIQLVKLFRNRRGIQ